MYLQGTLGHMLCCVQHGHHANSLCDPPKSPATTLHLQSLCQLASSPVSRTCLPHVMLSAVAEQTTLALQGSLPAGVHGEWTWGQLPSELAICLLSACASCSEIFLNCFFFPFSGNYFPMKADMKTGTEEYGGLSAVPKKKGTEQRGLILSDEAPMCSLQKRGRIKLHLDTWDLMMSLQSRHGVNL